MSECVALPSSISLQQSEQKYCRVCGCELVVGENWSDAKQKFHQNICILCARNESKKYRVVKGNRRKSTPGICIECKTQLIKDKNWTPCQYNRYRNICKDCSNRKCREYDKNHRDSRKKAKCEWRINNPEKVKIQNQNYRTKNRIKINESQKKYRINNPEKVKMRRKLDYEINRERYIQNAREWALSHPSLNFERYWLRGGREKQKVRFQTRRTRREELYYIHRGHRKLLRLFEGFFPLYTIRMVDI